MTGHVTAYIDDYPYFENEEIANGTPQPWPIHKAYNTTKITPKLQETHSELGTVAFLIIKNDSIWHEEYAEDDEITYGRTSKTNSFSPLHPSVSINPRKIALDFTIGKFNHFGNIRFSLFSS